MIRFVNTNLGSVYGNMAGLMFNMRDFTDADVYYKAIPMLEKGSGQTNLGLILKNYSLMLHRQNLNGLRQRRLTRNRPT